MKDKIQFPGIILNRPEDGTPFPYNPEYTGVAVEYMNGEDRPYIAEKVLPTVRVSKQEFKYYTYDLAQNFQNLDTKVGRKGQPGKVEFVGNDASDACENHAIEDDIPYDDINDAPEGVDPQARSIQRLTDIILRRREVITASLVFNTNSYHASNQDTLAAGDKLDNASTNLPEVMLEYIDDVIMRPNKIVFGQKPWRLFRTHPSVVSAVLGNSGTKGIVSRQQAAELLEVEEVLVGRSLYNTAKKGQTATLGKAWGDYIAMLYIDPNADTQGGVTFGFTAVNPYNGNDIWAGDMDDPKIGAKGGVTNRVVMSRKELVVANRAGFLLSDLYT